MPQVFLAKDFPAERALLNHAKQEVRHAIQSSTKLEDEEILYLQMEQRWATYVACRLCGDGDELTAAKYVHAIAIYYLKRKV